LGEREGKEKYAQKALGYYPHEMKPGYRGLLMQDRDYREKRQGWTPSSLLQNSSGIGPPKKPHPGTRKKEKV